MVIRACAGLGFARSAVIVVLALLARLQVRTIFHEFVYVHVEFQELLSDEVFDKFIIVHKFFIINFCAAFEFHLFLVILPFYLYFDKNKADHFQHFFWLASEFETNVESSGQELMVHCGLVSITTERVLWV